MRHWLRGTTLGLTLSSLLALMPACYAEVVAPGPPPAPRVVVMPVRAGHIWVDGRWNWNGRTWIWIDGYYERARHGHRWVPGHWQPQPNGAHRWVPGRWVR
jgi:hypothetical protein